MTEEFIKVWKLIQEDKEISDKLFLFKKIPEDFNIWLGENVDKYKDYQWLYQNEEQRISLIGIDHDIDSVDAIDDEGQLVELCEGLENVPYEILRFQCQDMDNESIEEVVKYEPDRLEVLKRYEDWCKKEGVTLDKNHIYHDENGNLFTHYFETP